ncbi:MAG: hypothetical protein ACK5RL_15760 [Acidimicrobiales bacterium]
MGMMDKAKDLAGKADELADMARDNADKIPGDQGDKIKDLAGKVGDLADKVDGD